jgi:hypothetical protein
MRRGRIIVLAIFLIFGLAVYACAEDVAKVTICQLKSNPPLYNHKLVEVTGFVSHGFEDFTFFDPTCPAWPAVWLEYGGKAKSGTMYCCGVLANLQRPEQLSVEDIPIPLVDDERFAEFDKLIHRPVRQSALVHGTLVGRFFAGKLQAFGKATPSWRGYGHMGCCSLFAIQEIKIVDLEDRNDLDYDRYADQPDIDKASCGYQFLGTFDPSDEVLQAQKKAESSEFSWAFDDPRRVASEALMKLAKADASNLLALKEIRNSQGRIVYQWRLAKKSDTYMVVVSKPYWVSFYAKDPNHVAWVVLGATRSSCGKDNSVTRVK